MMTEKDEGALLTDVAWIKDTLKTHVNDSDQKNIGAYKKMTWFNFTGLVGLALITIRSLLLS